MQIRRVKFAPKTLASSQRPNILDMKEELITQRWGSDVSTLLSEEGSLFDDLIGDGSAEWSERHELAVRVEIEQDSHEPIEAYERRIQTLKPLLLDALRWNATVDESTVRKEFEALVLEVARKKASHYLEHNACDFETWKGYDLWSLADASAILLGLEPGASVRAPQVLQRQMATIINRMHRSVAFQDKAPLYKAKDIVNWASDKGLDVPNILITLKTYIPEKPVDTRNRRTLYSIIMGLLYTHYELEEDFDTRQSYQRDEHMTRIISDIGSRGFDLDQATIKNNLIEARKFLREDEWSPKMIKRDAKAKR